MIHLITVDGKSGPNFYLQEKCTSDFKSLLSTITSGSVMIVSTRFRSDLFYCAEKPKEYSILKLWALYANTNLSVLDRKDFKSSIGDENSLSRYFMSINILAENRYYYSVYKKAFHHTFSNDHQNPVARTIVQCDQYLTQRPGIKRAPLLNSRKRIKSRLTKDTFSLAMHTINNETHLN